MSATPPPPGVPAGIANLEPLARRKEHRAWYFYDWANSAFATTIAGVITPNAGPYLVSTAAVALENTHNFGGGTVQPFDQLVEVNRLCREAKVGLHLDGARLWNAQVATGVAMAGGPGRSPASTDWIQRAVASAQ